MKRFLTILTIMILTITLTGCGGFEEGLNDGYKQATSEKQENVVFKWECTKDITHEGIEETKVLGVETSENADKEIPAGTYKVVYEYEEYADLKTTKRYNRQYDITILDSYYPLTEYKNIEGWFEVYSPDYYETKEITVNKGQYIYINHIAVKEAGDGTISLIAK